MKKSDIYKIIVVAIPTGTTIWNNTIFNFSSNNILLRTICWMLTVVALFLIIKWSERDNSYSFNENDRDFFVFFENWYSKQGVLSVFCSDLEWLNNDDGKKVIDRIRRKGNRANLYLRNTSGGLVDNLRASDVNIFAVAKTVNSQYRFSLIENEGIKRIIIRNKEFENHKISFVETSKSKDPYLVDFAVDLLEYCKI